MAEWQLLTLISSKIGGVDIASVDKFELVNILDDSWARHIYYDEVLCDLLSYEEIRSSLVEYNLLLCVVYQLNYLVWRLPNGHHLLLKRNIDNMCKSPKYRVLPFE